MQLDWQTAVVLFVIVAATAYLGRVAWRSIARRKAAACGGCDTCGANGKAQMVELGQLASSAPQEPRPPAKGSGRA
jgi:hypothetical protein